MPGRLVPKASGAHRLACLSLYRALLKESSALATSRDNEALKRTIPNLVRYCFKRDQNLQSPTRVVNGLKAGYNALDLLEACKNNSAPALNRLAALVNSTASQAVDVSAWRSTLAAHRAPTAPEKLQKIGHIRASANKSNHVRYSESKPILSRPLSLSEIKSGIRKIPSLVVTQGIPFLRYSKPQPISLGRVLRQKFKWAQKQWDLREAVQERIILEDFEDEWDRLIADGREVLEPSWAEEGHADHREIRKRLRLRDERQAEMAKEMWEVVKKEKELKKEEKIERRAKRRALRDAAGEEGNGMAVHATAEGRYVDSPNPVVGSDEEQVTGSPL